MNPSRRWLLRGLVAAPAIVTIDGMTRGFLKPAIPTFSILTYGGEGILEYSYPFLNLRPALVDLCARIALKEITTQQAWALAMNEPIVSLINEPIILSPTIILGVRSYNSELDCSQ